MILDSLFLRHLLLLPWFFWGLYVFAAKDETGTLLLFNQLLEEADLHYKLPAGFNDITPKYNSVIHYERAIRHNSGSIEIRYIIRPLDRISIEYDDPHNAAPEPNHLFPLLFESMINELSSTGGNTYNGEYRQSQAQELFNAAWASASVFDVNPKFTNRYSQALLLGIHKDGQADAYSIFLFNEYSEVKNIIKSSLNSLSFDP